MKIAIVFCFSNRLPKVTALPFSLRTSTFETAIIVSWEGISRGLTRGIGVKMGGGEEARASDDVPSHRRVLSRERRMSIVVMKFEYPLIPPFSRPDVGLFGPALWRFPSFMQATHQQVTQSRVSCEGSWTGNHVLLPSYNGESRMVDQ